MSVKSHLWKALRGSKKMTAETMKMRAGVQKKAAEKVDGRAGRDGML